jgi:hypothetical protein
MNGLCRAADPDRLSMCSVLDAVDAALQMERGIALGCRKSDSDRLTRRDRLSRDLSCRPGKTAPDDPVVMDFDRQRLAVLRGADDEVAVHRTLAVAPRHGAMRVALNLIKFAPAATVAQQGYLLTITQYRLEAMICVNSASRLLPLLGLLRRQRASRCGGG